MGPPASFFFTSSGLGVRPNGPSIFCGISYRSLRLNVSETETPSVWIMYANSYCLAKVGLFPLPEKALNARCSSILKILPQINSWLSDNAPLNLTLNIAASTVESILIDPGICSFVSGNKFIVL